MIILVTGQPRHGKSQYSIKLLLDLIKDNKKRLEQGKLPRQIYCNIAGVNDDDTITKLPEVLNQDVVFKDKKLWFGEHDDPIKPSDYICPPIGSVFIYDECHKTEWIKEKSGTLSTDPTCISMNEHGHQDYIFILITQFPQYVHTHLRGLVEYHYHSKRLYGAKTSKIYKFNEFQINPRSEKSLKDAYEVENFKFKTEYQNCYKSASAHDSMRLNIPKPFIYVGLAILAIILLLTWRYLNSPIKDMVEGKEGATFSGIKQPNNQNKDIKQNQQNDQQKQSIKDNKTQQPELTKEQLEKQLELQRKQFDLELEKQRTQMLMQYTELQMQLLQQKKQIDEFYRRLEMYKKQLPKDYAIQKSDPNLQVRAVVKRGNDCKAYNANGDLMTLTFDECNYYLQATGRVHKTTGGTVNQLELTPVHQLMDNPAYKTPQTNQNLEQQSEQ